MADRSSLRVSHCRTFLPMEDLEVEGVFCEILWPVVALRLQKVPMRECVAK